MDSSKQYGLTLVELLISISLIAIVSLLVATVYSAYFRLFINQIRGTDVLGQNKIALDEITNLIRQGQSVVTTCAANRCPNDTTGTSTIVLELWALDQNGSPTNTANDYIVLRLDPNEATVLIKKVYPDAASSRKASNKIVTSYLSPANGLQISYSPAPPDTTQVTVKVKTESGIGGKTQTSEKTAIVGLRNK